MLGPFLDATDVEIVDRYSSRVLVPNVRESVADALLLDGVYEPEAVEFLIRRLKPASVLVDVGANIGAFTVPIALRTSSRVIAIEASPRLTDYLRENVQRNRLPNVDVVHAAATDRDGQSVSFYDAPPQKFGMGSLMDRFHTAEQRVPARTVDSLLLERRIDRVDFMKIDVEGFEANVLRGAQRLLTAGSPIVLFEFCDWAEEQSGNGVGETQRILMERGYRLWHLQDYVAGAQPLTKPMTSGFAMLVAAR